MLIRSILFLLQTLVFLLLFALGSVLLPFLPAIPVWQIGTGPGRAFVLDGVVFALLFLLIILGVEAVRKRLRDSGLVSTSAFALALVLGLLMRFGFKSL